jgi:hypothetical protein
VIDGAVRAAEVEGKRRLATAWHTAALGRATPMPDLHDLLGEERPEQSGDAMAAVLDRWSVATSTATVEEGGRQQDDGGDQQQEPGGDHNGQLAYGRGKSINLSNVGSPKAERD